MDVPAVAQAKTIDAKSPSPVKSLEAALPAGKTVNAKITQISPDQAQSNTHRVKLQINNTLLEISAKFAGNIPEKGSSISLQRSENGQIQLKLVSDNSAKAANTTNTASSSNSPAAATSTSQSATQSASNSATQATASSSASNTNNTSSPVANTSSSIQLSQASNGNVILKAPVTINASGATLNVLEQAMPKGQVLSAKVVTQQQASGANIAVANNVNVNQGKANLLQSSVIQTNLSQTNTAPATANNTNQSLLNTSAANSAATNGAQSKLTQSTTPQLQNTPTTPSTQTANANSTLNTVSTVNTGQSNPSLVKGNLISSNLASSSNTAPASNISNTLSSGIGSGNQISSNLQSTSKPNIPNTANTGANNPPTTSVNSSAVNPNNGASTEGKLAAGAKVATGITPVNPQATALSTSPLTSTSTATAPAPVINTNNQTQVTSQNATNTQATVAQTTTATVSTPNPVTQNQFSPIASSPTPASLAPTNTAPALSNPTQGINQGVTTTAATPTTVSTQTTPAALTSTLATASPQPATGQTVTSTTTFSAAAPAPQNLQLSALAAQNSAIKIEVAGRVVSLQAPANLPPLQNIQITRIEGTQANIQWQQPSQAAPIGLASAALSPQQAKLVEHNLRQALPQQVPIAEGINLLVAQSIQIANTANPNNVPIDKIALSIMQLFGVKPGANNSSDTIKRNIQQGGLFTESKMASQPNSHQGDMKNFLAKLNHLAEQLPTEQKEMLQSTTERMLARITTSQLTHVQQQHAKTDISNERTFQIDIPVQNNDKLDNVEMEIKQRKHLTDEGDFISIWSVKLHFDLEERGEVDAEVALNPVDNSISTTFLCSKLSTVHELERRMTGFRNQLSQQGFEIQTLHCTQGSQAAIANNSINKRIIDIRT